MRSLEHVGAIEQGMIQRVGLTVTGVTKNRHHLHRGIDITAKSTNKLFFVPDLQYKHTMLLLCCCYYYYYTVLQMMCKIKLLFLIPGQSPGCRNKNNHV